MVCALRSRAASVSLWPPGTAITLLIAVIALSGIVGAWVGWFALQDYSGNGGATAVARMASDAGNAQIRRVSDVKDYVAAHQQFAPAMGMEYARPYIRSVASAPFTSSSVA